MRPLGGRSVLIRAGTTDAKVVWETFSGRYHLPPDELRPRTIWDLGANIGLTMAHMAVLYPETRLIGVELDEENARLCARNVAPWAERCEMRRAAVWDSSGEVEYRAEQGHEWGFRVGGGDGARRTAPALSLDELLAAGESDVIDYVKMDIEGAESRVLRHNTDWARHVRCINVEIHDPYSLKECISDLARLGFDTEVEPRHRACVTGARRIPGAI